MENNSLFDDNKSKMTENLFLEFDHVSKQEWIELAIKDLKGQDFEKRLVTKSTEGFSLLPFYTEEDSATFSWLKSYNSLINPPSDLPGMSPRIWHNAVNIDTSDLKTASEEIQMVLDNGADALVLELAGKIDFDLLLKDVLPQYIQIWLKPLAFDTAIMEDFFEWYGKKGLKSEELSGGLLWDSFSQAFDHEEDKNTLKQEVSTIHSLSQSYPNFKGICFDAAIYHNAGGNAVQEIGYSLALAVDILDGLTEEGFTAEAVFSNCFLKVAVGSNYFMEMAKLKTFRIAFHQLSFLYEVELNPVSLPVFAETSLWSKSSLDPYNNIIRNTSEAMSAILGGCNTLQVHPHDKAFHKPDNFSKRMARNISSILKEESYFDKVIDPTAGSYYIESLINNLYHGSIKLLKETEGVGGWWSSYQKHILQESIRQVRKEKHNQLSTRKTIQVGVNQYVDPKSFPEHNSAIKEEEYQLKGFSMGQPFLEMKARMNGFFKENPQFQKVSLLPLGPFAKPRIEFARNFFEAAGFEVNELKLEKEISGIVDKGMQDQGATLVLCGSDEDYADKALHIAKAFNNKGKLLVLAGYPEEMVVSLIDEGLKNFIHLKTNVIETVFQLTEDLRSL